MEIAVEQRVVSARFPSPEAAVELFGTRAAPIMAAQAALEAVGRWDDARAALVRMFRQAVTADGDGSRLDLGYTVATFEVAG